MSYLDDLRTCRYTSPSGKVFDLQFDEVVREGGKKLSVNEPPQQDRAEIQDLGNLGIRLPMTLYFSGQEYHTDADAFYLALSERYSQDAPATMSHPRWGDILVCPTTWTQTEGFVEGMGRATFAVEFIRVDRTAKFPTTGNDAGAQLQADVDAAASSATDGYAANGTPETPGDIATVTAKSSDLFTVIGDTLRGLASGAEDLGAQFEADLATALGSVDALVADPATLAEAVMSLARAPAVAVMGIGDKVRSYQTLVESIGLSTVNTYAEAELMLMSLAGGCAGACEATLTGDLGTRADAVESADLIDEILETLRLTLEAAQEIGWAPEADTVAALEEMLARARARLLEASFSLKVERRLILSGSSDPCSMVKKLYGTFSDTLLEQFILDNDLSDDEFFMIPMGREVVWYA